MAMAALRRGRPSGAVDGADAEVDVAVLSSPLSSLLHSLEHCPYCSLQVVASAPPPTPAGVFLLPLTFEVPLLVLAAPRTLHAWRHALSRGPPSIA